MNVSIRPLEEKDAYTSVKWRNTPEVWTYTLSAPRNEISIETELTWIRGVIADATCRRFAILADDVYVGNIYFTDIQSNEAEFSIFIGEKNYWGRGVARQAALQILEYGKEVLKLKTIKLRVNEKNLPAMRLYNSLGFKRINHEGHFIWMKLDLAKWPNSGTARHGEDNHG